MAFRGGRRGGYGGGLAKQEPFVLFPENVELPSVEVVKKQNELIYWNSRLQNHWKTSPYYIEKAAPKKSQDTEIERYSDRGKGRAKGRREPLSHYLKLTPANFPMELIQGSKRVKHDPRKVRWNPRSDLKKFDIFEKLEEKFQEEDGKKKKETENEDEEDDEQIEEEDEEFSDDGDYNQNIDFDDDEDDFNMDDGNDDEGIY